MANTLKIKRGTAATIPNGALAEPLFTSDTYDLYIGKGDGTNQRFQKYIASGTSSQFLKGDGTLDSTSYQPLITAGTTLQYYRGDKTFQTLDTAAVPENGAIYFTEPRVRATVLTGLNLSGGGTISASDSILTAFGKVQNQISALVGGATYQGTWNASTNTPTLASGTGTKGYYYVVSVAGSTNLDGITDWKVGDWAIFNGTTWDKVDNTDAVSSVNGFTGAVNLALDNISDVSAASPTNAQLLRFNGTSSLWENWTPNYITGNQTITLSGDVSGSGTTTIATTIGALKVTNAMLAGSIDYAKMDGTTVPTWNQNTTGSAATLTTARTLTIGATGKTFDGSANVTWSASDIGLTNYLPLTGGTLTGSLTIQDGGAAGNTTVFSSYKRLIFDNSYNDVARGPNKITLYNDGATGLYGIGISSATFAFYSDSNFIWYRSTSQTAFTNIMQLSNTGALTLTGALSGTSTTMSSTSTATAFIPTGSSVPTNGMYLSAANTLSLSTNSTRAITIDAGQKVGIGADPISAYRLYVNGDIYASATVYGSSASFVGSGTFGSSVTTNGGLISQGAYTAFQYNSAGAYPAYNTYFGAIGTNFSNSGSELDFWNTVGGGFAFRKQTGASAQTALLYISSTGAATFSSSVTANGIIYAGSDIRFGDTGGPNTGIIKWVTSNNTLGIFTWADAKDIAIGGNNTIFRTEAGAERMRITSGGNVGIGTASPGYKLHLVGGNEVGSRFIVTGTYAPIQFSGDNLTTLGAINAYSGIIAIGRGTATGIIPDLAITSGGAVQITNNLTANSPSEGNTGEGIIAGRSFKIDASGSGQTAKMYVVSNSLSDTYGSGLQIQFAKFSNDAGFGFNLNTSGGFETYVKAGAGSWNRAMTITSGGNVGIGTASPDNKLTVWGTNNSLTSSQGNINVYTSETAAIDTGGSIGLGGYYFGTTGYIPFANITGKKENSTDNNAAGYLAFLTRNATTGTGERMRITSGGQIVMGRTNPSGSGRLTVDGDLYLHNISSGAGQSTLKYNYTSTGLVTYDTSSRLLKKDIQNLSYGLKDVLKMSAKKYKWKRDESIDLGFIADEMFSIIPEIVFFSTEMTNETTGVPIGEPLSINYDRLIPVLVNAIQEQQAQIEELKSKLS